MLPKRWSSAARLCLVTRLVRYGGLPGKDSRTLAIYALSAIPLSRHHYAEAAAALRPPLRRCPRFSIAEKVSIATTVCASCRPRLIQERLSDTHAQFASEGITVVPRDWKSDVCRDLSIVAPQEDFTWSRIGAVADEPFEQFGHGAGPHGRRESNDGGLNSRQSRSVAFVNAAHSFIWSQQFGGRASQIDPPTTYEAGFVPAQVQLHVHRFLVIDQPLHC